MKITILSLLILALLVGCTKIPPLKRAFIEPQHVFEAQNLDIHNGSPITILKGNRSILISAPHALEVPRKSGGLADSGTGELSILLHKICDVSVIYLSMPSPSNPSSTDDHLYKAALEKLISEVQPKLVIDLHRAHGCRPFDIDFGTLNGRSCSSRTIRRLTECLRDEGTANFSSNFFSASQTKTVTKFVHNRGVEAVQIEINANWLELDGTGHDLHRFAQLLQGLSTFISMY